jgi:hypothetical protein
MTQGKPIAATAARLSPTAGGQVGKTVTGAVRGSHGVLGAMLEKHSKGISHVTRR